MRTKVVFYDDAAHFGGHESMTLTLVEHLACDDQYDVAFVFAASNAELRHRLQAVVPPIRLVPMDYASGRGQWLRTYVSIAALFRLARTLRGLAPSMLIVVQGGIALSSLGLLAGRLAGLRTVSYIPMTHDEALFAQSPWLARVRQWCVQPYYRLPHCLITISARMARNAAARRAGPVVVVENGIVLPQAPATERDNVRATLGLQGDAQLLLMVGRIEFWQKRHDLAIQAMAVARERGAKLHLLVVGSGPDESALRAQAQALGLGAVVHFRPWQADVAPFYAACDRLLLPSRYEGVPLVMLEAMAMGRQILAADVDGMADMLPAAWQFAAGDPEALAQALCASEDPADAGYRNHHRELVATHHSTAAFCARFQELIASLQTS